MTPFRWDSTCNSEQWVDCPELIRREATRLVTCAVPAQILRRDQLPTRKGQIAVPHVQTRCVLGHILHFPAENLNAETPARSAERAPETGEAYTDRPEDAA